MARRAAPYRRVGSGYAESAVPWLPGVGEPCVQAPIGLGLTLGVGLCLIQGREAGACPLTRQEVRPRAGRPLAPRPALPGRPARSRTLGTGAVVGAGAWVGPQADPGHACRSAGAAGHRGPHAGGEPAPAGGALPAGGPAGPGGRRAGRAGQPVPCGQRAGECAAALWRARGRQPGPGGAESTQDCRSDPWVHERVLGRGMTGVSHTVPALGNSGETEAGAGRRERDSVRAALVSQRLRHCPGGRRGRPGQCGPRAPVSCPARVQRRPPAGTRRRQEEAELEGADPEGTGPEPQTRLGEPWMCPQARPFPTAEDGTGLGHSGDPWPWVLRPLCLAGRLASHSKGPVWPWWAGGTPIVCQGKPRQKGKTLLRGARPTMEGLGGPTRSGPAPASPVLGRPLLYKAGRSAPLSR